MRKLTTIIGCIVLSCIGFSIAKYGEVTVVPQNTVAAANVLTYELGGPMPSVFNDGVRETTKDTVYVEKRDTVVVTNTKYVKVKAPKHTTVVKDTSSVINDTVNNQMPRDRKVFTPDEQSPKPAEVILFVDGEKVYSSETVITPIEPIEIDGLREP